MFREFLRKQTARTALTVALVAGLCSFGAVGASRIFHENPPASLKLAEPAQTSARVTYAPTVKKVLPAVVNIASSKTIETSGRSMDPSQMEPFFRRFFGEDFGGQFGERFNGPQEPRRQRGLGSGVIVSPEGYILTNNHVVDGANDVRVTLSDKREFKARVVGTDPQTDIAVLKIDGGHLPALTIGDSSKVEVGDVALAVGNPFGVGQTVTMGIVSATGRGNLGIEDYEDFIQTDAPINPGNSGGALVNDQGVLIGINTAILSHGSGGNQGIGFAVPVNLARQVMDQILKDGKVTRGYLGIMPQDVTPAIAKAFGKDIPGGALVGDVTPGGPAAKAGVQKGDIIIGVDGKAIRSSNELRMDVSMTAPGATVDLKLLREGKEQQIPVKLGELPVQGQRSKVEPGSEQGALDGVDVQDLDAETAQQLKLPAGSKGVVVTSVDPSSAAADAGLHRGDVIQEVNRQAVRNTTDFERAVRNSKDQTLLLVNRNGNTLFVAV